MRIVSSLTAWIGKRELDVDFVDVDFFIALKSDRLFPIIHTPIVTNKQIKVRVSQREPVPQMLPG